MKKMDTHTLIGRKIRIFLLSTDVHLQKKLQSTWTSFDISWEAFTSGKQLLERLLTDPPQMLLCSEKSDDISGIEVISIIKAENVFRQVCTVLLIEKESELHGFDWNEVEVDDFIVLPSTEAEMHARLELALYRSTRTLDANPLTRLPGNTSIMQVVEQYIEDKIDFTFAYLDIDNFKSFNDKYGFSRGDEALLMTARLLVSSVMNIETDHKFVGHIGGDDFCFIIPPEYSEDICQRIVETFDILVPSFYDAEDRERGAILTHNRQGQIIEFPLMSISIAVTTQKEERYSHFGEISQNVGQLKSVAKNKMGSCYVVDRRKG